MMLTSHIACAREASETIVNRRLLRVRILLDRAVKHLATHTLARTCSDFTLKNSWRDGDAFLALFDENGTCFAFDNESIRLWNDFSAYRDTTGTPFIQKIFTAKNMHISVPFNNLTMEIYTRTVLKDGKTYAIGCCFYPATPEYFAVQLVDQALQSFEKIGMPATLTAINDPYGLFVKGDIFVTVYDQDGNIRACGETYAHSGKIPAHAIRAKHTIIEQSHIKKFIESNETSYRISFKTHGPAEKKSYLKKYKDPTTGRKYIVAATFYDGIDSNTTYAFAQKAISYLKVRGKEEALAEFNNPTGQFFGNGMNISVYTPDGLCLAHSEDLTFIGHNMLDRMAPDGRFYTRELIDAVNKNGKAWMPKFNKNAYKADYAEEVILPEGRFIVSAEYYVYSNANLVLGMVDGAIDYIKHHTFEESILQFVSTDSTFLRGNTHISLFSPDGICLADGPFRKTDIWSYMRIRDDLGREIILKILDMANQGGGWVTYKQFNADYHVYARRINAHTQEGGVEPLIVLSGYYS